MINVDFHLLILYLDIVLNLFFVIILKLLLNVFQGYLQIIYK